MRKLIVLFLKCKKSGTNFIILLIRFWLIRMIYRKNIFLHQKASIKGINNIHSKGNIEIGIGYVGFMHKTDRTFLNIQGKLNIQGNYSIGRGCRFDVGKNALVLIGTGGYINCNSTIIIMHKLSIGDDCVISWNCQFLDEDFHTMVYAEKRKISNSIEIGNHVWIGCGVKIYKGTKISDGCVIASDSVVKGNFDKKECLIGGNPAKILKENIHWK